MYDEGDYYGTLGKACGTEASTGTPMLELEVWIDNNNSRRVYLPLTDVARAKWVDDTLEFLGFNGDPLAPEFDPKFYEEGSLPLRCRHDEYNGKIREKWDINRGAGSNAPMRPDVAARIKADWKARHGAGRPAQPKTSTPPPARSSPPPSRSAPPPAAAKPFGKDEAWAAWEDCYAAEDKPVNTDRWLETIARFGKPEERFTADDWRKIAEAATTPF